MQEQLDNLWDQCLSFLSTRIKKESFYTWLKPTSVELIDNDSFNILVPNQFSARWLRERYLNSISEALAAISNKKWNFDFKIKKPSIQAEFFSKQPEPEVLVSIPRNGNGNSSQRINLNPRYLFDQFVVGESNEFAYAACMAIAKSPGDSSYNPLFIYGGAGLGKTHLAQGIGHFASQNNGRQKILYATSEQFTNDFIRSLSNKTTHQFVDRYRSVDLLLIDDIQFLAGKESTQEQFFHTFNALHQAGKQIVLTADRPPRDILGLEERLLSRFSWGLVADIQPPTLETRIAILQQKAEREGVPLSTDVLTYIADSIKSNVRELEGALIRLLAFSSLRRKAINMSLAQEVLKDTIRSANKQVTIEQIRKKVATYFRVSEELLKARKKSQEIVNARQIAMYLSRTLTGLSLKAIGAEFGNRDHSTVIHACSQVLENIKQSMDYKLQIDHLISQLRN